MFENLLIEQNLHWNKVVYPQGVHRDCFEKIIQYIELPHVISVTGIRRSGKSTLLKQLINFLIMRDVNPKNILFMNLEHPYFAEYAHDVAYLEKMFEDYLKIAAPKKTIYCFLDEVQFFTNWPIFVKAHYEQKNVKFVITGSNSFLMSHELLTLLSGRTLPLVVYPLSFSELIQGTTMIDLTDQLIVGKHRHELRALQDTYVQYGGFPEVSLGNDKAVASDILNAYSRTILYQNVASRLGTKKPLDLERLFYYLLSHIGTPFSYSSLAKIFMLSDKTIKEYITAFCDAYLLFEVGKFSFSLKQQVRSMKKIYSIDTGMVTAAAFRFSENRKKLFENVVFLELQRRGGELYHYKTRSDYEVDFVLKRGEEITILQVCVDFSQTKTQSREIRALVQAAQELHLKKGVLITADEEGEMLVEGVTIHIIPLYKFSLYGV